MAGNKSRIWLWWLFFILASTFAKGNVLRGDSVRGKYSINDPRNPDCPCHFLQRKAEEEFRKTNKTTKYANIEKTRRKKLHHIYFRLRRKSHVNKPRKNKLLTDLPCFFD